MHSLKTDLQREVTLVRVSDPNHEEVPRPHGLHIRQNPRYSFLMQRALRSPSLRHRYVAVCTLVVFVLGSVGMPVAPFSLAGITSPGTVKGRCGCLHKGTACSCGCCAPKEKETCSTGGGCCQKRKAPSGIPMLSCPCGDEAAPGFVISTQPRLATAQTDIPASLPAYELPVVVQSRAPELSLSPETPPPRAFGC